MPGDAANHNDDEMVSQIDELKARMDRLMKGGTATSNSALLTDPPKDAAVPDAEPVAEPPPQRSRVRDLIGRDGHERLDGAAPRKEAVVFPAENAAEERPAPRPVEDRPQTPPPPPRPKPKPAVGGSLIAVGEDRNEARPTVESFDDLGSAIEEELARDASVPPPSLRKGPDLASRFGSPDEPVVADNPVAEVGEELETEFDEPEIEDVAADDATEEGRRSHVGAIVAIWAFTAVTSGTIAALHFTGII